MKILIVEDDFVSRNVLQRYLADSGQCDIAIDGQEDGLAVFPESEMRRRERENIVAALKKCDWKIYGAGGAAHLLGIKPTTLSSRIKKMQIKRPDA